MLKNLVLVTILVTAQIGWLFFMATHRPEPQQKIVQPAERVRIVHMVSGFDPVTGEVEMQKLTFVGGALVEVE